MKAGSNIAQKTGQRFACADSRWQLQFRNSLLALLVAGVLISGCSRKKPGGGSSRRGGGGGPVPVLAGTAVETNVPVEIRTFGNVIPYAKVTIRSQITGQLKQVHFREGQAVKRGDPLFTIDPRPAQGTLEQVRANLKRDEALLENARIEFDREQKLLDAKLISQDDFDKAQANLDTLKGTVQADQAAITGAELNVEFTSILAPVDGVTGNLLVNAGNIIKAPDDAMLTINQIHPIYVSFAVPERFLEEIKREMLERTLKVEAVVQDMSGPPAHGDLTFIDNTVDLTTGLIQLKGTFANTDNTLWPGRFAQVVLTLSEISNAIVVPTQAVQTGQNGQFVFVVKPDQTVEMRTVTTGDTYQGATVISRGLKAGETVVTDGQLRLTPGTKVSVKSAGAAGLPPDTAEESP